MATFAPLVLRIFPRLKPSARVLATRRSFHVRESLRTLNVAQAPVVIIERRPPHARATVNCCALEWRSRTRPWPGGTGIQYARPSVFLALLEV